MKRNLLAAAFWLLLWSLAARAVNLELTLPGPLAVAGRLWTLAATGGFWWSAACSLLRVLAGFLAGSLSAVILAAAAAWSSWAGTLLSPAIRVLRAAPVVSFILLILLWTDKNTTPAVVAGLMVLPVVWENTLRGVRETDPKLLELSGAYRFGPVKTLRLVYAPSVLPYAASGCRTGLGLAWKAGVSAEVLCVPLHAAGTEMYRSKLYLETADLLAWTAAVVALSLVLEWALGRIFDLEGGKGRD